MRSSVKCAPPRYPWRHLLTSALLLASVSVSATSLVADVGKALERLATVSKPFALVPGVRVVKRETESPGGTRRRFTLVDSAERVFRDHDLVLDAAPGLEMRVTAAGDGRGFRVMAQPSSRSEPRTFGVMRRLKLVLLPIMYKLGVITTLLTLLTVFALKGLTIGVLLLIMGSVGLIHKFKVPYHEGGAQKDVHVHVHGGHQAYSSPIYHSAESPWDRNEQQGGPQGVPPGHPWPQGVPPGQPWAQPPRYPHHLDVDHKSPWDQFIN
ncbi:hypothetical protein GE061_001828 [Apolygus lucorum]|uniref:Uncharacterized protein n=1 Tax=Apolygus lucorum TaxID=248454 RepID=A0A8S9X3E5_APOLU|nr:hypothetical protein GE061_001828 [Apolygus lucorum]